MLDAPLETKSSKFRYITDLIREKRISQQMAVNDPVTDEIESYLKENYALDEHDNPLEFWKVHTNRYPALSALAQDVLVIPATSAPVERVFSQAGIACGGKRNRLAGKQLESEVMLKINEKYY